MFTAALFTAAQVWKQKVNSITNPVNMNLSKLWKTVKDREAWYAAIHGVEKCQTRLSDCTTTMETMLSVYWRIKKKNYIYIYLYIYTHT